MNITIPPKKWVLLLSFWSKLYNWDSFLLKEWALLITMKKKVNDLHKDKVTSTIKKQFNQGLVINVSLWANECFYGMKYCYVIIKWIWFSQIDLFYTPKQIENSGQISNFFHV